LFLIKNSVVQTEMLLLVGLGLYSSRRRNRIPSVSGLSWILLRLQRKKIKGQPRMTVVTGE
jgi:hypothetical protein